MAAKKQTKDEAFEQELERRKKAESGSPAPESDGGTEDSVGSISDGAETDAAPEAPTVPSDKESSDAVTPPPASDERENSEGRGDVSDTHAAVVPAPSEVVEVVAHPVDPNSPFRAMDQHDEALIIEEIEGRMSEVLVYRVPGKGEDLSWPGVREAIRLIGEQSGRRIRITAAPPIVTYDEVDGQKHIGVMVQAEDEASGQAYWGSAHQPIRMKLKNGSLKDDEFALQKALSKAQRNALKYFIPENIRQGILAIANHDPKKLREITMGKGAPAEDKPKALSDPEAEKLIKSCRETYKALKREYTEFGAKVPPGRFNADLQAAWSSHEALKTFLGQLEEARDVYEKAAA